jgi:FtsP/CotA-like multicopper oxidase with cupredoxin domain
MPGSAPGLPDPAPVGRTRTFALGVAAGVHTINGLSYNLARIDFQAPCGEVEIWEFVNQTQIHHPMHVHAAFFRVLTRNGAPAALPMDRGWVLHRSSDLANWTPIDGMPLLSGNTLTWREPTGAEPRFYRLAKP